MPTAGCLSCLSDPSLLMSVRPILPHVISRDTALENMRWKEESLHDRYFSNRRTNPEPNMASPSVGK